MKRPLLLLRRKLALPLLLSPLLGCADPDPVATERPDVDEIPAEDILRVHYYRPLGDYAGWELLPTGDVAERLPENLVVRQGEADDFGAVFVIPTRPDAQTVRFTIASGADTAPAGEIEVRVPELGKEVWVFSEKARAFTEAPAVPAEDTAIVYYRRPDDGYDDWGLHLWGDTATPTDWSAPVLASGEDSYGAWYEVPLAENAAQVNFIIHQGDAKDPGPDQALRLAEVGRRIWVLSGDPTLYTYPAESQVLAAMQAHWVDRDTFAWKLPVDAAALEGATFTLVHAPAGGIRGEEGRVTGGSEELTLTLDPAGLGDAARARFPHLAGHTALRFPSEAQARLPELLKGQLVVVATLPSGKVLATGVQLPGVLDDRFATDSPLGVDLSGGAPTLRLWAPTARAVRLHLFDTPSGDATEIVPMTEAQGVWRADGDPGWMARYYLFEVEVFAPSTGKVETNLVTDPYALSLSMNSQRSQIIDLHDPALAPLGWSTLAKPQLASLRDTTLYELHVRDFSIHDLSVPAGHRGKFLGFTHPASDGMTHLTGLAQAGLTHVHLLPTFDFATVNEDEAQQQSPVIPAGLSPDSQEQQAAVWALRDQDGFNWGYDPWHYTVPEGSYATAPDGPARIVEFRSMVQALNQAGLRVVMDVVYNHTSAAGQNPRSVLDRIVPGYYHRLDDKGAINTSTCCQNTATEHTMMQRLMVDSLLTWATAYKVDGFRFDLMGHHMKANLIEVRDRLAALTLANDGVDGSRIVLYGEGWDFGEVAGQARGENATQAGMAGTGIATFNDRLRDAIRGGDPFDSGAALQRQGFATGLYTAPNAHDQGTEEEQRALLLDAADHIRLGLAGNLRDYEFEDRNGVLVTGKDLTYKGAPAGYTAAPGEAVTYVEAHDNQTLWDMLQVKVAAGTTLPDRVRLQNLSVSVCALGLGVPFFHAGMEMLRSKSLDRDSFNSGDWFNRLDFTYTTNNWGVGLPPAEKNQDSWDLLGALLANPALQVDQAHIVGAVAHFQEVLQIRRSSPLFRLETAEAVSARVRFHNTGPDQVPGVIVMAISDEVPGQPDLDPATGGVLVVFNARPEAVTLPLAGFDTAGLSLHPVQENSADGIVKQALFTAGSAPTVMVPARTTAVFVGTGLP
ncbi:pullulanase-type alpha-1,6-glucosidase [Chondromyces apiculatus]|uniref:pullulanase n=1 Tax=Chondromyces apiculatus DSM 436 TaxID=1192034 RepID=A0A017T1F1_9BACT|nr:pullulanase-type alpha-1,6-glucosidase [Chondromyces apiculatus]EYF03059.1 Neopullulanase [Chondromyces apiculatus DSM 436]